MHAHVEGRRRHCRGVPAPCPLCAGPALPATCQKAPFLLPPAPLPPTSCLSPYLQSRAGTPVFGVQIRGRAGSSGRPRLPN